MVDSRSFKKYKNGIRLSSQGSAPSNPSTGSIYINSSTDIVYIYNSSGAWVDASATSLGELVDVESIPSPNAITGGSLLYYNSGTWEHTNVNTLVWAKTSLYDMDETTWSDHTTGLEDGDMIRAKFDDPVEDPAHLRLWHGHRNVTGAFGPQYYKTYHTPGMSIAYNTTTKVTMSGNDEFECPADGLYHITCSVKLDPATVWSGGYERVTLYYAINDSTSLYHYAASMSARCMNNENGTRPGFLTSSRYVYAEAGDELSWYIRNENTATVNTVSGTYFGASWRLISTNIMKDLS